MNKGQLIDKLSAKTQLTKVQSEEVLDAALEIITRAVSKGEDVKLVGFGTFSRSSRSSRVARNPKTGEAVTIQASNVPRFKPGKEFRAQVR